MRQMINEEFVIAHRQRAMNPDRPVLRGTAQNPDVFFQAREACNPFYAKCADITEKVMESSRRSRAGNTSPSNTPAIRTPSAWSC